MCDDMITIWRNNFDAFIEKGGEECLCDEKTVIMALELENKIRSYEGSSDLL